MISSVSQKQNYTRDIVSADSVSFCSQGVPVVHLDKLTQQTNTNPTSQ